MARLILASSSPRRKELLKQVTPSFEIITSDVDEQIDHKLLAHDMVMTLASRKAEAVARLHPDAYVIGADTLVIYKQHVLGKPANEEEAREMLTLLSGKTHSVYTGVTIIHQNEIQSFFEKTDVTFWELTREEINHYIKTGEPLDKAGSYGIQGYGALLVKSIKGDFFTVVGLPIATLYRKLMEMDYRI